MHVSAHRLLLPALTASRPAPKANSELTEFADMAGVAEDLKVDGKRRGLMRRPSQRSSHQRGDESAASDNAANNSSFIAASSPALRATFDLTLLGAANPDSDDASPNKANGRSNQKGPTNEPSLGDLLTLVRSAG